jgi:site-specific DNA recombinase
MRRLDSPMGELLPSVRRQVAAMDRTDSATALADRELIECHVARVSIKPEALEVRLNPASEASAQANGPPLDNSAAGNSPITITLPWTAPSFAAVKGIVHEPSEKRTMKPEGRDTLHIAIAKARKWIDDIRLGHCASFAEIAEREAVGERHIRLLAPLAFLSPRIIAAIADGTAPADLTVTGLANALPYSWAEQEKRLGLPPR